MKQEFVNIPLRDNSSKHQYELTFGGKLALIEYQRNENTISLVHTEVDPDLEGKGAGSAIVEKVLEQVKADGLKIVPLCSFVRSFIKRHPQWESIQAPR